MKKTFIALSLVIGMAACKPAVDYKTERDEVMKFHDVVMEDHGKLVDNQMKLDTLIKSLAAAKSASPSLDTLKEKEAIRDIKKRLNNAEEIMNDWMHQFEPDITGKSNAEAVTYFKAERVKIGRIDSLYKTEIKTSDDYLAKFKK